MATKLKLLILAKDILENDYTDSSTCPITRALARAGRPDLVECVGIYVKPTENELANNIALGKELLKESDYPELDLKLQGMYNTKRGYSNAAYPPIPIKDFTATITLNE